MFVFKIADLKIKINNHYDFIKSMCKDYIINSDEFDFEVCATKEEIKEEEKSGVFSPDYLETLAVYRKIAKETVKYNVFLLHGVILDIEGEGVAFLAKSGTGKTTHAILWKKLLGNKCRIINGDKPLIRLTDEGVFAYGTPWCGKEGLNINDKVLLKNVCFIERSENNSVERCDDVLKKLMTQFHVPDGGYLQILDFMDTFIKKINFYTVKCNMDISAAKIAYNTIIKGQ